MLQLLLLGGGDSKRVEFKGTDDGDTEVIGILELEFTAIGFIRGVKDDKSFFTCGGVNLFVFGSKYLKMRKTLTCYLLDLCINGNQTN